VPTEMLRPISLRTNMAASTVRLNNAAASSIGKRFRKTLKRFCFHMFHFLQLISKGYKRQKEFYNFQNHQNRHFRRFCKLQKSKISRFGRFANCKKAKSVVLAFLQVTKEQNQMF
jgi:hypothetical protein